MARNTKEQQGLSVGLTSQERKQLKKYIDSQESTVRAIVAFAGLTVGLFFLSFLLAPASLEASKSAFILSCLSIICIVGICFKRMNLARKIEYLQSVDEAGLSVIQGKASKLYNRKCAEWGMTEYPFNSSHSNFWVTDDTLCIVEDEQTYLSHYTPDDTRPYPIYITEIPIDKIQYYTKEGDVQYTSHVSGGGGGGSSLKGAVIGGVIAGDAGAIIGSRKKVNPIITETRTHDSRQTVLRYYDDFGKLEVMTFKGFNVYDFLLGAIPDKDLTTIQLGGNSKQRRLSTDTYSSAPSRGSSSAKSKLIKLQELYLDDQITLEEYEEQRKRILNEQ